MSDAEFLLVVLQAVVLVFATIVLALYSTEQMHPMTINILVLFLVQFGVMCMTWPHK